MILKANFQPKRDGRIIAFQAIYSYDLDRKPLEELLSFQWLPDSYSPEALNYASLLINGTVKNLEEIDRKIILMLKNWDFNRLSLIDKAILRFSVFSLLYETELTDKIIINEAVEIAKIYGGEDSYKFVNGILDAIRKAEKTEKKV